MLDRTAITRRGFCGAMVVAALALPLRGAWARPTPDSKRVRIHNTHTGEKIDVVYWRDGEYCPDAMTEINHALRCHYTGEVADMDANVSDLLWAITRAVGSGAEAGVISGYRSPAYNDYLRRIKRGVARNSLHTKGMAVDISIDGLSPRKLARIAKSLRLGGVGTYRNFVHVDTGDIRYW